MKWVRMGKRGFKELFCKHNYLITHTNEFTGFQLFEPENHVMNQERINKYFPPSYRTTEIKICNKCHKHTKRIVSEY